MDITLPIINLWFIVLVLSVFWIYFLIYAYRNKLSLPWGFGIVIIGVRLAGLEIGYPNSISVDLPFLASLFGVLWNITNIRKQILVQSILETLYLIGIGLVFGLLLGIPLAASMGIEHFQNFSQFSSVHLVTSSILGSIGEELLFRGYFLSYLRKYGFHPLVAIVLQALVFTAGHTGRNSGNWVALGIIFLVGTITGYITWRSNKLFSACTLHIVANLVGVIWGLSVL